MEEEIVKVGDVVTYRDEHGVDHNALVCHVHNPQCINVVYLSSDSSKSDSYGRQRESATSVSMRGEHTAHGRYFTV